MRTLRELGKALIFLVAHFNFLPRAAARFLMSVSSVFHELAARPRTRWRCPELRTWSEAPSNQVAVNLAHAAAHVADDGFSDRDHKEVAPPVQL
jgi:hypothetical protein